MRLRDNAACKRQSRFYENNAICYIKVQCMLQDSKKHVLSNFVVQARFQKLFSSLRVNRTLLLLSLSISCDLCLSNHNQYVHKIDSACTVTINNLYLDRLENIRRCSRFNNLLLSSHFIVLICWSLLFSSTITILIKSNYTCGVQFTMTK